MMFKNCELENSNLDLIESDFENCKFKNCSIAQWKNQSPTKKIGFLKNILKLTLKAILHVLAGSIINHFF